MKLSQSLPTPWTGDFTIIDVNRDGWNDLVVTEKMKTDFYGLKGNVFVLINQKDNHYNCEMIKTNLRMLA